jgi:hypothetical protein
MFIHQQNNTININNQARLTVAQFRALEPNYPELPLGYTERYYEPNVRHDINGPNQYVVHEGKNWEDGNRYFLRIQDFVRLNDLIQQQEQEINAAVQTELDKRKSYEELRQNEYPSIEKMVVAMWENLIEKQTKEMSGVKELQKLRKEIKEKYPKPEN